MSKYKGNTQVKIAKPQRSTFDHSHERRLSTRMGKLTPILCKEVLPNDSWFGSTEVYVKLAPLQAPIFHALNLYVHHFFVPCRLLWEDFETFITGGRLGEAIESPPVPPNYNLQTVLAAGGDYLDLGQNSDYLGIPPLPDADAALWAGRTIDAMPFAGFYKVWYDYYRDRNFTADDELLPMVSGTLPDSLAGREFLFKRYRCWEHDRYTSALPFTQRGAEVLIPMEGSASWTYSTITAVVKGNTNQPPETFTSDSVLGFKAGTFPNQSQLTTAADGPARIQNLDTITFQNGDVSIEDLRSAITLQQWMERNAVAGSRYNETIMAHFARRTSDARIQRAEYIGGGRARFVIDEVMTTSYSEDASSEVVPPANPTGKGTGYLSMAKFSYHAEEWGFIYSVLSVMPTSGYMQGIPKMFTSRNFFTDYPWPLMANLGEEEVYDHEIYFDPTSYPAIRADAPNFGYQSRYSDWKQTESSTHGDFRDSLKFWHLTRDFAAQPNLGQGFVTFEDALQDRIFSVTEVDTLWIYLHNKLTVKRSLPYFNVPSGLVSPNI